jgi:hypothetical protein
MIKEKLYSYHFSCGNSTDGPIGFCARVKAKSKEEALEILRRVLPEEVKIRTAGAWDEQGKKDAAAIEYIEAYISPDNIKIDDIDEHEEVKER